MYCNYCGKAIPQDARLCAYCGKLVAAGAVGHKRLQRARNNRKIAGVCAGFAEYFDLDVTLIRIVWAVSTLLGLLSVVVYLACWIIMPEEPLLLPAPAPTTDKVVNT